MDSLQMHYLFFSILDSPPADRRRGRSFHSRLSRSRSPFLDLEDADLPSFISIPPRPASTTLQSPDPVHISCPVCLDDAKEVRIKNIPF